MIGCWIRERLRTAAIESLHAMSVGELKALWDRYSDDGSSIVDGHDLDDVYLVLNAKGHGDYCDV